MLSCVAWISTNPKTGDGDLVFGRKIVLANGLRHHQDPALKSIRPFLRGAVKSQALVNTVGKNDPVSLCSWLIFFVRRLHFCVDFVSGCGWFELDLLCRLYWVSDIQ